MRRLACKRPIPIFWYFISQLLVEISIWNSYRALIGSLSINWKNIDCHRSKVKATGTVHCFLKVQSYHKNWAIENFQYFFVDTSLYALSTETIKTRASFFIDQLGDPNTPPIKPRRGAHRTPPMAAPTRSGSTTRTIRGRPRTRAPSGTDRSGIGPSKS